MTPSQFGAEASRQARLRKLLEEGIEIYDGYDDKETAGCLYTLLTSDLSEADLAECAQIAAEILSKAGVSPDAIQEVLDEGVRAYRDSPAT